MYRNTMYGGEFMKINKELLKGSTTVLILSILNRKDMYGYEMIKEMDLRSKGVFSFKEGTLYPVVHNLLKKEYISSRDEIVNKKIRVYYHIEPIGKEYLEQTIIEFRKNMQGVFEIIAYGEGKKDE